MRKTVLSAAHGHANKQARIEIQMERRHYLSIVCAHSLRMNFMVIAASSPYLFTTTAVGVYYAAAGAGNINTSNGVVRTLLDILCARYHRLRGIRTLERHSIVYSCRAVVTSG